jgi:hypothetical protein
MRAAGINPMVAYSQGGASTPSGAGWSTDIDLGIEKGVSSALDIKRQKQEMLESNSRRALMDAQGLSAVKSAQLSEVQSQLVEANLVSARNKAAIEGRHPDFFGWSDALLQRFFPLAKVLAATYVGGKAAGKLGGKAGPESVLRLPENPY